MLAYLHHDATIECSTAARQSNDRTAVGFFMRTEPIRSMLRSVAPAALPLALAACATPAAPRAESPTPRRDVGWVTAEARAPRVEFRTFESRAAGGPVSFHVYSPAAAAAEPARRFPVVYWLHGSGGGAEGIPRVAALFDRAIAAGRVPPVFVVFVNGLVEGMYCDWKDGTVPLETVIVRELVPHVDATLPTVAAREGRILDGFSMGGYGAARLAFSHQDLFATASLLGAGPMQPDLLAMGPRAGPRQRDEILKRVYGGDPAYFLAVSPWQLAEDHRASLAAGRVRIRQIVGSRDAGHLAVLVGDAERLEPLALIRALDDDFWHFYRDALAPR
jgi:S-formylglutathione hydrolase FrmB